MRKLPILETGPTRVRPEVRPEMGGIGLDVICTLKGICPIEKCGEKIYFLKEVKESVRLINSRLVDGLSIMDSHIDMD